MKGARTAVAVAFIALVGLVATPAASAAAPEAPDQLGQGFFNSGFPLTARGDVQVRGDAGYAFVQGAGSGLDFTLTSSFLEVERHVWRLTRIGDPLTGGEVFGYQQDEVVETEAFASAVARATFVGSDLTLFAHPDSRGTLPRVSLTPPSGGGATLVGASDRVVQTANDSADVEAGDSSTSHLLRFRVDGAHVSATSPEGVLRAEGNFTLYVWDMDFRVQAPGEDARTFRTGEREGAATGPVREDEVAYALVRVTDAVLEVRGASGAELIAPRLKMQVDGNGTLPSAIGGFRVGDTKYEATGQDILYGGALLLDVRPLEQDAARALVDVTGHLADVSLTPAAASDGSFLDSPSARAAATGGGVLMLLTGAAVLVHRRHDNAGRRVLAWAGNPLSRPVTLDRAARVEAAVAALAEGNDREAVTLLDGLLAETPDDVVLLVDHGCALERLGRTRAARDAFERAVTGDPANAEAHYYYARILARLGLTASALPHLQRAVTLDPRLGEMAGRDSGFRSVADHPSFVGLIG